MAINLGNVVGLTRSETPPTKKYVLWGKILNPSLPFLVEINYWDDASSAWIPVTDPSHQYWLRPALDNAVAMPPASPSEGDRFLIPPAGATGGWAGKEDQVATWRSGAWVYQIPKDGYIISVRSLAKTLFDYRGTYGAGGSWAENDFQVDIAPNDYIPKNLIGQPLGIPDLDENAFIPVTFLNPATLPYNPTTPLAWPVGTLTIKQALDYLAGLIIGANEPTYSGPNANQSFGGISAGYNPTGKTALEILKDALVKYINPSVTALSITSFAQFILELGTTISGSKTFNWTLALGSGAVSQLDIVDVTAALNLVVNTPNDGAQAVTVTTRQLNTDGATQIYQLRLHDTNVVQDILSGMITYTGRYNIWSGSVSSVPTNSAQVRALAQTRFHTGALTFIHTTDIVNLNQVIAIRAGTVITSIIDLDASDAPLTAQYVLAATFNVADAGGTNRSYDIYKLVTGVHYSTPHRHQVTTSN